MHNNLQCMNKTKNTLVKGVQILLIIIFNFFAEAAVTAKTRIEETKFVENIAKLCEEEDFH